MRKFSGALLAIAVIGQAARAADWKIVSASGEPASIAGVEHRRLSTETNGQQVTIDAVIAATKMAQLQVLDNPRAADRLADVMLRRGCVAGVNGGYFDPEFKPIGLLISDGKTIAPLTHARLLRGVLCSSPGGVEIVRLGEFSPNRKPGSAVECGPFLVDSGSRVSGLDRTRSARRTFAAVARDHDWLVGVCSPVTLDQLGDLLSKVALRDDFKLRRALNLDGGSSSAFWFAGKNDDAISIPEEKTVRDFVGVAAK